MRQKNLSEKEVASLMGKFTFSFVDNIHEARTPSLAVVESNISYFTGFKIGKIGRNYFVEVTDPAKRNRAMVYAKKLAADRIRHYNDDESQLRVLEDKAAREAANFYNGPKYVEDLDAARAKSYETGHYGIYIDEPFRQLPSDFDTFIGA